MLVNCENIDTHDEILEPKNGYGRKESRWGRYPGSNPAQHEDKMYRNRGIEVGSRVGEECKKHPPLNTRDTPFDTPVAAHPASCRAWSPPLCVHVMLTLGVNAV